MSMTFEEAIAQLRDLRIDRKAFEDPEDPGDVFTKDIEALDTILETWDRLPDWLPVWVDCDEELPKLGQHVLVYCIDNLHSRSFVAVAYLGRSIKNRNQQLWTFPTFPRQSGSEQISEWMQYEVTHWMYLPDPPKEE